jgi:hypothetical protein
MIPLGHFSFNSVRNPSAGPAQHGDELAEKSGKYK